MSVETTRKLHIQHTELLHKNEELLHKIAELKSTVDRLQRLNREKDFLIAAVAHDLRGPLNQMQGLARIILMEKNHLTDLQEECAERIDESASGLAKLVAKILDPAAIEVDGLTPELRSTSVDIVLMKSIAAFRSQARKKKISLHPEIKNFPLNAFVDSQLLHQVFNNLLSNAIKFSPVRGDVNIKLYSTEKNIITEIGDTGPGFMPHELQHLFTKFRKFSARPTANEDSYGLGLSIVKKYLDLMEADITCESAPGQGAKFIITLPRSEEANASNSCPTG